MFLIFIHLIRSCADNTRVFQRVLMNLNMTIGQAACRHTQGTLIASCFWWSMLIVTCVLGERFGTHLIKVQRWYCR